MKDFTRKTNKTVEKIYEYYLGIDIHKKKSYFYIIDRKGERIFSGNIDTTNEAYRQVLEKYEPEEIQIAIEIGSFTFTYCDLFVEMGIDFHIVNTLKHADIAKSHSKTDKKDAMRLAINLWKDVLPERVYMPTTAEKELRQLISHRAYYVKQKTRLINKMMAFFSNYEIVLNRKQLLSYEKWLELEKQITVSEKSVLKLLFSHSFNELNAIYIAISESEELLKELIEKDENFNQKYTLLESIPGIGFITAITIIAMAGNVNRFKNVRQFVKYLGLAPSVRDSGGKQYGSRKITKEGNGLLRGYLGQGGISIMRASKEKAKPLQDWYRNVKDNRGWKKARVAMARKLAHIVFGILTHEMPYDPALVTLKKLS